MFHFNKPTSGHSKMKSIHTLRIIFQLWMSLNTIHSKAVLDQESYTSTLTGTVTMSCTYQGPNVIWYKDFQESLSVGKLIYSPLGFDNISFPNFQIDNEISQISKLTIQNLDCIDVGAYTCTETLIGSDVLVQGDVGNVSVELIPRLVVTAVDIDNILEGNDYEFMCTASNANPAVSLSWKVNGIPLSGSDTGPPRSSKYRECDAYSTNNTLMYSPNRTDSSVVCISSNQSLSSGVQMLLNIDVKYPPTCKINEITFKNNFNNSGEVICSCGANPTAAYTFYENNNQVTTGVAGDTYSFDYVVPEGSKTTVIYCKGVNSVGEDESEDVTIISFPEPTAAPTTEKLTTISSSQNPVTGIVTTEAPTTEAKNKGGDGDSNLWLIIGIIIGVILIIIVVVGVAVYCMKYQPAKKGVKTNNQQNKPSVHGQDNMGHQNGNEGAAETGTALYAVSAKQQDRNQTGPSPAPRANSQHGEADKEKPKSGVTYAEVDHGNVPATNKIHQPNDGETQYASIQL